MWDGKTSSRCRDSTTQDSGSAGAFLSNWRPIFPPTGSGISAPQRSRCHGAFALAQLLKTGSHKETLAGKWTSRQFQTVFLVSMILCWGVPRTLCFRKSFTEAGQRPGSRQPLEPKSQWDMDVTLSHLTCWKFCGT